MYEYQIEEISFFASAQLLIEVLNRNSRAGWELVQIVKWGEVTYLIFRHLLPEDTH